MEVERYVERLAAREDRLKAAIVEEEIIRRAVDHAAMKAEFLHAALKFVSGGFRRGHRQMREAGVARGVFGDLCCQRVVDFASERRALCGRQQIGAGT